MSAGIRRFLPSFIIIFLRGSTDCDFFSHCCDINLAMEYLSYSTCLRAEIYRQIRFANVVNLLLVYLFARAHLSGVSDKLLNNYAERTCLFVLCIV